MGKRLIYGVVAFLCLAMFGLMMSGPQATPTVSGKVALAQEAPPATKPAPAQPSPSGAIPSSNPASTGAVTVPGGTLPLASAVEKDEFYRNGRMIAQRETRPDADGHFRRVTILETTFKYPKIRVEESLRRENGAAEDTVISRVAMVADHLLVGLHPEQTVGDLAAFVGKFGGKVRQASPGTPLYIVELPEAEIGRYELALKEMIGADTPVSYAEPDYIVHTMESLPNDPSFNSLWGLHNTGQTGGRADADIDAVEAWEFSTGSAAVIVGVIDTGIDYNHNDLIDNRWVNSDEIPNNGLDDDGNGYVDDYYGWDFVNDDNDPMDDHYHGTHCAGTIGATANNGIGVAGVAHEVSLMALKFLSSSGSGSTSDAVSAVYYATGQGAHITSNSWGGGGFSQSLKAAIEHAGQAGSLFVAAAGNSSRNTDQFPAYPASYDSDNIISVAATDHNDHLASFSNYGTTTVDLAAPGVSIYSTSPNGGYRSLNGTSMATPHVSGAAALLLALNPGASWSVIKESLLGGVDVVEGLVGDVATGGRLNAATSMGVSEGARLALVAVETSEEEGNGDGILNPGETVAMVLEVKNIGVEDAPNVFMVLALAEPTAGVAIVRGGAPIGHIPSGERGSNTTFPFLVRLTEAVDTPQTIPFEVLAYDGNGESWVLEVSFDVLRSVSISGQVRRLDNGSPIGNATITYKGTSSGSQDVEPDGTYELHVTDGQYTLTAHAPNFVTSEEITLSAPPAASGVDFELGRSLVEVSPESITWSQHEGTTSTHTVSITNGGNVPLDVVLGSSATVSSGPNDRNTTQVVLTGEHWGPEERLPDSMESIAIGPNAFDLPYFESWEERNYDDWVVDGSYGSKQVTTETAVDGIHSFRYDHSGSPRHNHCIHQEFSSGSQPRHISFYVRSGSALDSDGYVVFGESPEHTGTGIFFFARSNGKFYVNDEHYGDNSIRYNANQWYRIEFRDINWDSRTFDYFIDGSLVKSGIPFRNGSSVDSFRYVHIYNFSSSSTAWWDNIYFSQSSAHWVSVDTQQATIEPGATLDVEVTLSAEELLPDIYSAVLDIRSNDPATPHTTVPIQLTVTTFPNDPPTADEQELRIDEDESTLIILTGADPDGNALTARLLSLPQDGTLYQTSDGVTKGDEVLNPGAVFDSEHRLIYVPDLHEHGSPYASFDFVLNDGRVDSEPAAVTIHVASVNDPVVAVDDSAFGSRGQVIASIPVLNNDKDPDGDTLTILAVTQPERGTASNNGDGTLKYAPDADFVEGTDFFTYLVTDGKGFAAVATVSVSYGSLNPAGWPMYGGDPGHSSYAPGSLDGNHLQKAWEFDFVGAINQVSVVNGVVYITPNNYYSQAWLKALHVNLGTVAWEKDLGLNYRMSPPAVRDGIVYLQRTVNSKDLLSRHSAETGEEIGHTNLPQKNYLIPFSPTPALDAVYFNSGYDLVSVAQGTGEVNFQFRPSGNLVGFSPTIGDGQIFLCENGVLKSYDPETGDLNWQLTLSTPAYGTSSKQVTYRDGRAFVALSDGLYVVDTQTRTLLWSTSGYSSLLGKPSVSPDRVFIILPHSVASFDVLTGEPVGSYSTYPYRPEDLIVTDDTLFVSTAYSTFVCPLDSSTATQTFNVGGTLALADGYLLVNSSHKHKLTCFVAESDYDRPPTAVPVESDVPEDGSAPITLVGTDDHTDTLLGVVTSLPADGHLYQTSDGVTPGERIDEVPARVSHPDMKVIYEPLADAFGSPYTSFAFKVHDGRYFSNVVLVTVNVIGSNDPPQAVDDLYTIRPGDSLPGFRPESNDFDVDLEALTVIDYTEPSRGTLSRDAEGAFTYLPDDDFLAGTDTFTYTVRDDGGLTDSAMVSITVDATVGSSWTTYGNGPSHTGVTPVYFRASVLQPVWENDLGVGLNQAAISRGRIFVSPSSSRFANNWLMALDERTGTERWMVDMTYDAPGNYVNPPTYHDGRVYVQRGKSTSSNSDSRLWCFDEEDGRAVWSTHFSMQWETYLAPCIADGKIWVNSGYYGGMSSYDLERGSERFFVPLAQYDDWTPTYYQGRIFSFVAGQFHEHNPDTGAILWSLDVGWDWSGYSMRRSIAISGDIAVFITNSLNRYGELIAVDIDRREIQWRRDMLFRRDSTPAIANGLVYTIEAAGNVSTHTLGSGLPLGTFMANDGYLAGQPILANNRLFVASHSNVYVFDLQTQELLQTIDHGGEISVANGKLIIAGSDGVIRSYGDVNPDNSVPEAEDAEITVDEESTTTITLEASDDDGDDISFVIKSLPAVGQLYHTTDGVTLGRPIERVPTLVDDSQHRVIYQAPLDRFGDNLGDFQFAAADDQSSSALATVSVHLAPVNDPPQPRDDRRFVLPGQVLSPLYLVNNDIDVDGDDLEIVAYSQPNSGTVAQNEDGTLRYTADPDVTEAEVSFTYLVRDAANVAALASVYIRISDAVESEWTTFGNGPSHSGYVTGMFDTRSSWQQAWEKKIADEYTGLVNPLVVADGRVYMTPYSYYAGMLAAAYDENTGEEIWSQPVVGSPHSINPPTYHEGALYVQRGNHSGDTQLWSLSATTGATNWSSPHGAQWERYFAPCVADGKVWVNGGAYGGMYGFDLTDGRQLFFHRLPQEDQWTPSYHQGKLYSFVDGMFINHDPETGAVIWSLDLTWDYGSIRRTVAFEGNYAYLVNKPDRYGVADEVVCVDLTQRKALWRYEGQFRDGTPAVAAGAVYVVEGTSVHALSYLDGKLLGTFETESNSYYGLIRNQPIVTENLLLTSSNDSTYIFDRYTYELLQTLPVGGYLTLTAKGLYIAGTDGFIYAYRQEAAVRFSPGDGTRSDVPVDVTLTASDPEARIHYTVDGSSPHLGSPSVVSGGKVRVDDTAIVRAISVNGSLVSPICEAWFEIGLIDTDGDSLPDWWEIEKWGNLTTANASSDSDMDGRSDLDEWLAGTDPTNAKDYLALTVETLNQPAEAMRLSWPSSDGRNYQVEACDDMTTWSPLTNWMSGTGGTMEYTDTMPDPKPNSRFYRLRVKP